MPPHASDMKALERLGISREQDDYNTDTIGNKIAVCVYIVIPILQAAVLPARAHLDAVPCWDNI